MLIGADALTKAGSAINFESRSVTLSGRSFPIIPRGETPDAVSSVQNLPQCPHPSLQRVIESNQAVFGTSGALGECTLPAVTVNTGDHPPIRQKAYRTPFAKKKDVEKQVAEMLALGVIRPSMSPWASPITLQPKKDGTSRFCIDFRRVNGVTKKDAHPIANIKEIFDQLGGAEVFSTLDLKSGYWQIPVAPNDREKTAFVCHLGLYEYNRLPFGLANAPAQFQRVMNYVLADMIGSYVLVYLDDIIIFSSDVEEHASHVDNVLKRLQRYNMTLKAEKCHFAQAEVELLGYTVSSQGITAQQDKTAAIQRLAAPTTVTEVRSFLGTVGYYRGLIPSFASIAEPITRLTRKNEPFVWGDEQKRAFNDLKHALASPPIIAFPNTKLPYALHTDASAKAIGAILTQTQGGHERVIAYLSHQLSPTQSRWSTIEREAYAVVHALDHLRCYLWGAEFTVYTDHRPLTSFFRSTFRNAKLERWAMRVSEYGCPIEYRPGKNNVRADMLSRAVIGNVDATPRYPAEDHPLPWQRHNLDPSTMAQDQRREYPSCWASGEKKEGGYEIAHGFLYSNKRPATGDEEHLRLVLPSRYHPRVVESAHHEVGHQSIIKTLARVRQGFVWPGMRRSVERFVRSCPLCALYYRGKAERQPSRMPLPPRPLHTWGLDLIGPFAPAMRTRNRYALTAIDHLTGWAEVIPIPDKSSKVVWSAFCQRILSTYGLPEVLVTDQGGEFTSKEWEEFLQELGVDHRRTTAYHPESNGRVERFNGTLKRIVEKLVRNDLPSWESTLGDALWAYRTSYHTTLGTSPYRALFGIFPRQPKQGQKGKTPTERVTQMHRIRDEVHQLIDKAADKRLKQQKDLAGEVPTLHPGDAVLLKNHVGPALQTKWDAGWTVEGVEGPVIQIRRDRELRRVNRAKLRLMPPGAQVVQVDPRTHRRQHKPLYAAQPGDGLKVTLRRVAPVRDNTSCTPCNSEWESWLSSVRNFCCPQGI